MMWIEISIILIFLLITFITGCLIGMNRWIAVLINVGTIIGIMIVMLMVVNIDYDNFNLILIIIASIVSYVIGWIVLICGYICGSDYIDRVYVMQYDSNDFIKKSNEFLKSDDFEKYKHPLNLDNRVMSENEYEEWVKKFD